MGLSTNIRGDFHDTAPRHFLESAIKKHKLQFGKVPIICADCRKVLMPTSTNQSRCPTCGERHHKEKMSEINRRSYLRRVLRKSMEKDDE